MSDQLTHIKKQKQVLETRAQILRYIREFFWSREFLEVETPLILGLPGQEPYLSPMKLTIHDDTRKAYQAFLHTSPEYTLKKMLASGFGDVFSLCKTFRDYESFGGTHNPEFTMLEWYRVSEDMFALMEDVETLLDVLQKKVGELEIRNWELTSNEVQHTQENNFQFPISKFTRISMKALWQDILSINLDTHLTQETMLSLCKERGYTVQDHETYEDLFYRIFLNEIEPEFKNLNSKIIIYNYPAPMAALAKLSQTTPGYAERFEVYIHGIEIANAFTELTDRAEQLLRLQEEQVLRKKLGRDVYDIDMDFVDAVGNMPECAGIALGVDRLVQVLLGVENIDDVLVLPMSKMY
jgi:lysyl-tRNA synthetase class 2